ncbi:MAG TPA: DNA-binding response regulator [Desulfotomaculum sp.]|nr:MAG: PhoP family transcriptional regulator [Desulfotomaculum sp. BICA1-6]HBX23270.1 DNA-binding response regulator [Desulfotomaculum sp.]
MTRILVVDDERLLVKGLQRSLNDAGFEVQTAYDGTEALARLEEGGVDLVVLDLMLPGVDGFEVCRRVRRTSSVPIIMLTARGDDVDKIVGLELGADDYLAKPFNTRELIARIRAVLRRAESTAAVPVTTTKTGETIGTDAVQKQVQVIRYDNLEIDVPRQQVRLEGREIELTAREFDLLYTLARHPGRIFTREILLEQVWGTGYFGEPRVVDVYIRRLRQKIELEPASPRWVMTRWGAGYYFREFD